MRSFDFIRFRKTFCWTLANNKSSMLTFAVVMSIVFFVTEELLYAIMVFDGGAVSEKVHFVPVMACVGVGYCAWLYSASTLFACTKTKASSITFLTHPASNMEKFLSRWVFVTVVAALLIILSYLVADAARAVFNMIVGWQPTDTTIGLLWNSADMSGIDMSGLAEVSLKEMEILFSVAIHVAFVHSFYLLGSALFRRNRFILTSLTLMLLQAVASLVRFNKFDDYVNGSHTTSDFVMAGMVVFVFVVFNYWASYRLFVRTGVINNKWINI